MVDYSSLMKKNRYLSHKVSSMLFPQTLAHRKHCTEWGFFSSSWFFPLFLIAELNDPAPGSSDCMCTLPIDFSSKVADVFPRSLWRNDNRSKLWPWSLFKAAESRSEVRRNPAELWHPQTSWKTVVVRWNAPWRWKATRHKWFGATVFRKWQKYSFPDLSQNKLNQNSSHAAIIATWHYPTHIQCRMHFASEMGWVLGKWKTWWQTSQLKYILDIKCLFIKSQSHLSSLTEAR